MSRSIVITGFGAISALGTDAQSTWDAVRAGQCGIVPRTFDAGQHGPQPFVLPAALAPEGFQTAFELRFGKKVSSSLDRFALLALCAAYEALEQADLIDHPALSERAAIVLGHGQAGFETLEKSYERFFGVKTSRLHPGTVPKIMVSGAVSAVAMQFGVHGPVFATSSACASSAHAIVQGAGLIASGQADVAVVGGSEAIATPSAMSAWLAIQALASETCRPFSRDRDGMVMAEGGAVLILEAREHAEARGAKILGEYLGAGMSSDAFHITQPSLEGPASAIRKACAAAGVTEDDDLLIVTHGTGTVLNDQNETAALRAALGEAARRHPAIATKSAHGHLIGGSAALQAVLALQSLAEGVAPPIQNYLGADPACDLNLVVDQARPIEADKALVNAFAFGGLNVTMAFGSA